MPSPQDFLFDDLDNILVFFLESGFLIDTDKESFMFSRRAFGLFSIVFFFLIFAIPAFAQEAPASDKVYFGPQLSWGDDADMAVGVRAATFLESLAPNVMGMASFDYFFPDDGGVDDVSLSYVEVGANLAYNFVLSGNPNVRPYVGGGVHLARASVSCCDGAVSASESEFGLNVLAGLLFGSRQPSFFIELRSESKGGEQIVLTGGVLW